MKTECHNIYVDVGYLDFTQEVLRQAVTTVSRSL